MHYYNEFNPKAAAALRQAILDGLIPNGEVDTRSITDVRPEQLEGYSQCHFFAGIGMWPFALRLAGWPEDRPVWTGSCPCQPFSRAGKKRAQADARHLFPTWENLIEKCRPTTIYGEQVEAAITNGWLDEVACGLESKGYAFGSAVLSSLAVQGFNKGERVFFLGASEHHGWDEAKTSCGVNQAVYNGKEGQDIPVKFARTSSPAMLSAGMLEWRKYPDGRARPIDPRICLLGDEHPTRVSEIHALGNALDPYLAAEFITATM